MKVILIAQNSKSTLILNINIDKLREKYTWLFWQEEILKLHGFLEVYEFEYCFNVGYQANMVYSEEEIRNLFKRLTEELPWILDCTTNLSVWNWSSHRL